MRQRLTDNPARLIAAASSSNGRREIPDDFKYNTKKLKHLKAILHNVSVALGTLTSAFNEFSRFKGPEISPDGRLGGVGYILPLKDIKQSLQNAIYSLSDVADCLADEMTNPRWNAEDDKEIKKLIKEKDEVVEKVEEDVGETPESPSEDISHSDVVRGPAEPSVEVEQPQQPIIKPVFNKAASNDILAQAVRQSLVNFIENT